MSWDQSGAATTGEEQALDAHLTASLRLLLWRCWPVAGGKAGPDQGAVGERGWLSPGFASAPLSTETHSVEDPVSEWPGSPLSPLRSSCPISCGLGRGPEAHLFHRLGGAAIRKEGTGKAQAAGVPSDPWRSRRRQGSPVRERAPGDSIGAVCWKGGAEHVCSRPEGAAEVVPRPRHKLPVTCSSRDCPPC